MDVFSDILLSASVVTTIATLLGAAAAAISARWAADRAHSAMREAKIDAALQSDDLDTLGKYLFDDLGSVSVSAYLHDDEARRRFRHTMARVESYLGLGAASEDPVLPLRVRREGDVRSRGRPADDPIAALEEELAQSLESGETWNALARLRRRIETEVRGLAVLQDVPARSASLRRLVRLAASRGAISLATQAMLEESIVVANRAVHGEDVEPHLAFAAIQSGLQGLRQLQEAK